MTGFETVILQIDSPRLTTETNGNPPIVLPWKTCVSNLDERRRNYVYTNYDAALNAMSKRFEHALGPSQAIADAPYDENVDYARYIEFHPRKTQYHTYALKMWQSLLHAEICYCLLTLSGDSLRDRYTIAVRK